LKEFELTGASEIIVRSCMELLWRVEEEKRIIRKEILFALVKRITKKFKGTQSYVE
jgi:hypothetical protein